ncbi:MAG: A24 family peptidase [Candidatus Nitrosotenuis sp.]
MNDVEIVRIFVVFGMLAAASYYDLRVRKVNDMLWVVFGSVGVFLYFFDWPSPSMLMWAALEVSVAFSCWKLRLFGGADVLALVTLSVILPIHDGAPVMMIVLAIALVLASSYAVSVNSYRNLRTLIRNGKLFEELDESCHKKLIAFFLLHQRNDGESGFAAEAVIDGRRRFVFRHDPDHESFGNCRYVTVAFPLMPFLLLGMVLFIGLVVF